MKNIHTYIKQLLKKLAGDEHQDLLQLIIVWKEDLDEKFTQKTQILKFEKKILYVRVINHLWLQELLLNRPIILEKLRQKTKIELENILFVL